MYANIFFDVEIEMVTDSNVIAEYLVAAFFFGENLKKLIYKNNLHIKQSVSSLLQTIMSLNFDFYSTSRCVSKCYIWLWVTV